MNPDKITIINKEQWVSGEDGFLNKEFTIERLIDTLGATYNTKADKSKKAPIKDGIKKSILEMLGRVSDGDNTDTVFSKIKNYKIPITDKGMCNVFNLMAEGNFKIDIENKSGENEECKYRTRVNNEILENSVALNMLPTEYLPKSLIKEMTSDKFSKWCKDADACEVACFLAIYNTYIIGIINEVSQSPIGVRLGKIFNANKEKMHTAAKLISMLREKESNISDDKAFWDFVEERKGMFPKTDANEFNRAQIFMIYKTIKELGVDSWDNIDYNDILFVLLNLPSRFVTVRLEECFKNGENQERLNKLNRYGTDMY